MAFIPTTLIQPSAPASNSTAPANNATIGGASKSNNPSNVGNNIQKNGNVGTNPAVENGNSQRSFSQLLSENIVTVTPELAALVDGLETGQEVTLDVLEKYGISLDALVGAKVLIPNADTKVNHAVLGQTNLNTENVKNGEIVKNLTAQPIKTRDDISNQPIQDIVARIANAPQQNNLALEAAKIASNNLQNNQQNNSGLTDAQLAQLTPKDPVEKAKNNQLAAIASKTSDEMKLVKENIQVNPIHSRSASSSSLGQSLFTTDSEAAMKQFFGQINANNLNGDQSQNHLHVGQMTHNISDQIKSGEVLPRVSSTSLQTPAEQISVKIAQTVQTGANKIEIHLEPAHLGKVHVQIDVNADGKAHVMVLADKNETLDMLKGDSRALEQALKNAGLQADAGSLEFGLKDQSAQQFAHERNKAYQNISSINGESIDEDLLKVAGAQLTYQSNQALNILA